MVAGREDVTNVLSPNDAAHVAGEWVTPLAFFFDFEGKFSELAFLLAGARVD